MKYSIGIDFGGTNIAVGLVDENYTVVTKSSLPTGKGSRSVDAMVGDMALLCNKVCADAGVSLADVASIGIATPGSVNSKEGIVICCPPRVDFSQKAVQDLLRNAIIRALKKSAEAYLPPLLAELAEHYGFKYKKVKITGSKSRWGSCSATGSINLSCYLMLLPPHLMDYVLLHELTHTKEMNHGPKFWEILDELTEGKAKTLRAELKNFRTSF